MSYRDQPVQNEFRYNNNYFCCYAIKIKLKKRHPTRIAQFIVLYAVNIGGEQVLEQANNRLI